jgi:pyruvate/2-oxoglutarate/acetoin dehydrogenase E1 component
VSIGSAATEALRAYNKLPKDSGVELIVATSYKDFDEKILKSVERTENLVVVEDHFTHC